MVKLKTQLCKKVNCPHPFFKKRERHQKKYHQPVVRDVLYGGTIIPKVERDPLTLKFPCPCGLAIHARYSSTNIHGLCRTSPHTTDPDAFLDSEDEFVRSVYAPSKLDAAPEKGDVVRPPFADTDVPRRDTGILPILNPSDANDVAWLPPPLFGQPEFMDIDRADAAESSKLEAEDPLFVAESSGNSELALSPVAEDVEHQINLRARSRDCVIAPHIENDQSASDAGVQDVDIRSLPIPSLSDSDSMLLPVPPSQRPESMGIDPANDMEYCTSEEEDSPSVEGPSMDPQPVVSPGTDDGADATDPQVRSRALIQLRERGIDIEPDYNLTICIDCGEAFGYQQIHSHRKSWHCQTRAQQQQLGNKQLVLDLLIACNAHQPRIVPPGPIPSIRTLKIIPAFRCAVPTCSSVGVFSSKRLVSRHCAQLHPDIPPRQRPCRAVQAQRLGHFRGILRYIEVTTTDHLSKTTDAFPDILRHYKDSSVGVKSPNFQSTDNPRAKTEFLAKTRWDSILESVNVSVLRSKVAPPNPTLEQAFCRLKDLMRSYYHNIAAELDFTVSTLVLRYIHSPNPEKDLKKLPFHKPQEKSTIDRDADFITAFIIFLFRVKESPVPSYDVVLHDQCSKLLIELRTYLETLVDEQDALRQIHNLIFALLSNPSSEFLSDQWQDPFLRFLVTFHLQDNRGTFSRVTLIPPTISQAQWAFRATAAREVKLRKPEFHGDCFAAYERYVRPFLTEKQPSTFNTLREQMSMISALALQHPGLPLFGWDVLKQNLSIDGRVLPMTKFVKSIHAVIDEITESVKRVFRATAYDDILDYIDARLDPQNPEEWFRDHPQEFSIGTSVFNEPNNGFERFRLRLLKAMASESLFFTRVDGELVAKRGNLWEWYGEVDNLVGFIFFGIIMTWASGFRGAEFSFLQFEIRDNGQRNLYILNGLVTIVTEYVKTRSFHGHGNLIARTIPWQLARLLLLVYAVVFPAASHLAVYAFDRSAAEAYLSYMFVLSGKVMDSEAFSKVIASQTSKYFDITMGLRMFRQTMKTIMTNLADIDFGEIDGEDWDLAEIDHLFGHTRQTREKHYAIQTTNALRDISHTSIASSQRIALRWHAAIRLGHPKAVKTNDTHMRTSVDSNRSDVAKLVTPLASTIETVIKRSNAKMEENMLTTFTEYAQGIGSRVLQRIGYATDAASTIKRQPEIMVHPAILPAVKSLLPHDKPLSFTLPQQAEAIQSSITDSHVLLVMPTGSGKSLSFFAAPLLLPDKMFILITPLVALTNDMSRRLAATSIRGGKWCNRLDSLHAQLVIASAHQAGTTDFYLWAKTNSSRIFRLFIDEAHHIFTSDDYRDCFKLFDLITELGKPITFLTATIFPQSVPLLCERMKIDPSLLLEIRAPTVRPNIKITATHCPDFPSMMDSLQALVTSIDLGEKDRGLIFCTTVANCKTVAKLLGVDYYVAKMKDDEEENQEERLRLEEQFRQGTLPRDRWMVATLCFGQGVDLPGVRWVIHVEVRNVMNYSQEVGRAGRDGELAFATAFYTDLPRLTDRSTPGDHEGVAAMIDCLVSKRCRRLSIGKLDHSAHSCAALGAVLCDVCEDLLKEPISKGRPALRFDLETQETSLIPRSISVKSNAHKLRDHRRSGQGELEVFQTVLDSIKRVGCVDCWFAQRQVEPTTLPHKHSSSNLIRSRESALKSKTMESPKHWPFCYLCWVPFRAPCNHPPHVKDGVANPDRCEYQGIVHRLIVLIWHDESKRERLADILGEESAFTYFTSFSNWLGKTSSTADEIPQPHHFIVTYYKQYRLIPTVEHGK